MTEAIIEYQKLQSSLTELTDVSAGQMFGKSCLKVNGKAFMAQQNAFVVFKLPCTDHALAIKHATAVLWDPSGKGRPMKEWVALTVDAKKHFGKFAKAALDYVRSQT